MKTFLFFTLLSLFCLTVSAQNWVQLGNEMNGAVMGDYFGLYGSISSDGNTVAVGAPNNGTVANKAGQVQAFTFNGTTWSQKGNDIYGEAGMERSGNVVLSANGNIMAIHAVDNGGYSTKVRVYEFDGSDWVKRDATIISETGSLSGGGVDISADGNMVVFGNTGYNSSTGQVKVFAWNGTSWVQQGADIQGASESETFGAAVGLSADGTTLVIGAPRSSSSFQSNGQVSTYTFNGSDWIPKGNVISGEEIYSSLGNAVGISSDGNTFIVGEKGFGSTSGRLGRTKVFSWNGTQWTQKGSDILGVYDLDYTGQNVAINNTGDIIATQGNGGGGSEKGNARMFKFNGMDWVQLGETLVGPTNSDDRLGSGLDFSASGNTITIGSPRHDGFTGRMQVYRYDGPLEITENIFTNISIYPNPSNGTFTINFDKEYTEVSVQIYNILGQIISSEKFSSAKTIEQKINASAGTYFVKVSTTKEGSNTLRIIKQ